MFSGKGFILGSIAGAAGLIAMEWYWKAAAALSDGDPRKQTTPRSGPLDSISLIGKQHRNGESATEALGRILYKRITGSDPQSQEMRTALSYLVHWAVSVGMGGVYGAVRGRADRIDGAGGATFGTAVWLLGDELFSPLVGLAKGPTAYPAAVHAHAFGAHLAYGLTTSAVTQLLLRLLRRTGNAQL
jgi:hypothetical protein